MPLKCTGWPDSEVSADAAVRRWVFDHVRMGRARFLDRITVGRDDGTVERRARYSIPLERDGHPLEVRFHQPDAQPPPDAASLVDVVTSIWRDRLALERNLRGAKPTESARRLAERLDAFLGARGRGVFMECSQLSPRVMFDRGTPTHENAPRSAPGQLSLWDMVKPPESRPAAPAPKSERRPGEGYAPPASPSGWLTPRAGDEVVRAGVGVFGTGASQRGVVESVRGRLMVRPTSTSSVFGSQAAGGKRVALTEAWRVVDDPEWKRQEQAREAERVAKAEREERVKARAASEIDAWVQRYNLRRLSPGETLLRGTAVYDVSSEGSFGDGDPRRVRQSDYRYESDFDVNTLIVTDLRNGREVTMPRGGVWVNALPRVASVPNPGVDVERVAILSPQSGPHPQEIRAALAGHKDVRPAASTGAQTSRSVSSPSILRAEGVVRYGHGRYAFWEATDPGDPVDANSGRPLMGSALQLVADVLSELRAFAADPSLARRGSHPSGTLPSQDARAVAEDTSRRGEGTRRNSPTVDDGPRWRRERRDAPADEVRVTRVTLTTRPTNARLPQIADAILAHPSVDGGSVEIVTDAGRKGGLTAEGTVRFDGITERWELVANGRVVARSVNDDLGGTHRRLVDTVLDEIRARAAYPTTYEARARADAAARGSTRRNDPAPRRFDVLIDPDEDRLIVQRFDDPEGDPEGVEYRLSTVLPRWQERTATGKAADALAAEIGARSGARKGDDVDLLVVEPTPELGGSTRHYLAAAVTLAETVDLPLWPTRVGASTGRNDGGTDERARALRALRDARSPRDVLAARGAFKRAAGGSLAEYSTEEMTVLDASNAWVVELTRWDRASLDDLDLDVGDDYTDEQLAELLAKEDRKRRLRAWDRAHPVDGYPTQAIALQAARDGILSTRDGLLLGRRGRDAAVAESSLRVSSDGLSLRWQPTDDPASTTWQVMSRVVTAQEAEDHARARDANDRYQRGTLRNDSA